MNWLAVQFVVLPLLANLSNAAQWTPEEMNPGKLSPLRQAAIAAIQHRSALTATERRVVMKFIILRHKPSNAEGKPTILYISGGPGQIVPGRNRISMP